MRALEAKDYTLFDSMEPSNYRDVLKLGTDAPYFVGLHLVAAGREEDALRIFEIGESSSPEPYASLCANELSRRGPAASRLTAVSWLLERDPNSAKLQDIRDRLLIELGKGGEVPGGLENWITAHSLDESLVKSIRESASGFSGEFAPVYAVRANVAQRIYGPAWAAAKSLLETGAPLWRRLAISDIGKAALYGSQSPEKAAVLFGSLKIPASAEKAEPGLRFLVAFYEARLYDRAGKSDKAKGAFIKALALAATDADRDSALRALWNSDLAQSPSVFLADFEAQASNWTDPSWFKDILETVIVRLVQERKWKDLDRLRVAMPDNADPGIRSRLAYLSALTVYAGSSEETALLSAASDAANGSLYYRIMAAAALGTELVPDTAASSDSTQDEALAQKEDSRADVLRGLFRWYLPERVYQTAESVYPDIPVETAAELAAELESRGLYADSIRLVSLSLRGIGGTGPRASLELLYPRPWQAEVSAAAARYGVPEYLLFALIRSESLFQPSVVSEAGAHGLTQLMKPTAKDLASRMGLGSFDIEDPLTNISIGAFYLSYLVPRFDGDYLSSFYAYNAGLTRVREWMKAAEGLPPEIRLEGLPYAETRDYGRKILSAAAMYGYLYYGKSYAEVVRELFPPKHT